MEINSITLIFGQEEKKSRFPNNIDDLKKICLEKFGLGKIEDYSFYYEDNNIETEIDENNFDVWKSDNYNFNNNIIKIKEKQNYLTQSSMYNFPQTRESQLLDIKGTLIIDKDKKGDLLEEINNRAVELKGNIDSEQCLSNTQDYGGRVATKTIKNLENQIYDNYNFKQNTQKNDDNRNSEANTNNNIIKAKEINVKIEKKDKTDEKEKLTQLENEIKSKDIALNENNNIIENYKKQIENLKFKNRRKDFSDKKEQNDKIAQYNQKIITLNNEYKQLGKEYDKLTKECNNLKKEINEYNKENIKLKKEINEYNKENIQLKKEINEYNKENINLKKDNDQLKKENQNYKKKIKNIENSKNKTIHDNIECNKCNKIPIKGYRYICSKCNYYNICEQCYEINLDIPFHKHYFFRLEHKISKEYIEKFRNKYNTPSKYNNASIAKVLDKIDGNLEDAFFKLFLDN